MLSEGDTAPGFTAQKHDGEPFTFEPDGVTVLYFYPKDDTPGCTTEACAFRDRFEELKAKSVTVIGVSADDAESHRRFREKHGLPFTLLADPDHTIADRYDVPVENGSTARITYLIKEGRIAKVYEDVDPEHHADELLEAL